MIRPTWPLAWFMRVLFLALVVLGCFAQPARAAADKSEKIVIGPRAPWVDLAPDSRPGAGAPPGSALGDVYDEISDEQIHVRPVAERGLGARMFTTAHYTRTRRHIVTSSGVERASELRFEVDRTGIRPRRHCEDGAPDEVTRRRGARSSRPQVRMWRKADGAVPGLGLEHHRARREERHGGPRRVRLRSDHAPLLRR